MSHHIIHKITINNSFFVTIHLYFEKISGNELEPDIETQVVKQLQLLTICYLLHKRSECILWQAKPNCCHFSYNLRKKISYTITLEIIHNNPYKWTGPHWWVTSIADIILYPHESMVFFQSGKPSGMTGSELSSCTREMEIKRNKNQIILY